MCIYGGDVILKLELVIKNIQYSELIDTFITKDSIGVNILKSTVRKLPPRLKNEAVIIFVNKNKYKILKSTNRYMRKRKIPVVVTNMELYNIGKEGR